MKGATTVETSSGMGGATIVENVNAVILVCKMLLLDLHSANIFLARENKDEDIKPSIGNVSDRPRESADMQVDSMPTDDFEPTEEDVAAMMGFGGFSTTKVWLPFFISSVHNLIPRTGYARRREPDWCCQGQQTANLASVHE
jgi:hypothetical protein